MSPNIYSWDEENYKLNRDSKLLPLAGMIVHRVDDKLPKVEAKDKERVRIFSDTGGFMEQKNDYYEELSHFAVYTRMMKTLREAVADNKSIMVISPEKFSPTPNFTNFRRYVYCTKLQNYGGLQYSFCGECSFEKGRLISTIYILGPEEVKGYQSFRVT